jgi:hypothetical protein
VQVGFVRRLQAELKVVSALATIRLGRLNSGNLVSLIDDDGNQYEICKFLVPNQSTPPINVEFDSVVGADYPANNIEFKVVSSATTTGLQQNVELWNWTNGTWDSSNLQNMLLTEQSSLTAGVSGNHIQPATRQVRARVRVAVTGLVRPPRPSDVACPALTKGVTLRRVAKARGQADVLCSLARKTSAKVAVGFVRGLLK